MGRILVDLVGNPGLSGLEDGAGNAFAPSNNRIVRNRFVADRILKDGLLLFVIGQENRTGFCADLFQRKRFSELRTPNPELRMSDRAFHACPAFSASLVRTEFSQPARGRESNDRVPGIPIVAFQALGYPLIRGGLI